MKFIRVVAPNSPPVLAKNDSPAMAPDQVKVRISTTALNFADLLMMQGKYQDNPPFPLTPGLELSGEVIETGAEVSHIRVGDRVAAITGQGGLAEVAIVDAQRIAVLPDTIDNETAAAFQITYATAHIALVRRARIQAEETVVVLGAAGGAGLAAIEVAKAKGATVIAVARGSERLEVARASGADRAIDSATEDVAEALGPLAPFDIVYDAVGGVDGTAAARRLRPEGRHILIGFASGDHPTLKPNHLLVKNIDVIGVNISAYPKINPVCLRQSIEELIDWHAKGLIKPYIGHRFTLDQAAEALELLRSRQATGKIVVTP